MLKFWDRMLLIPKLAKLSSAAPRDPNAAWELYWSNIHRTGLAGEVLWDSDSDSERGQYLGHVSHYLDPALPVLDIGAGNGTYTRWLATLFPEVIGVDVSASAVRRAEAEAQAQGISNARFLAMDLAVDGAGQELFDRLGPANVFVRGVLHVLKAPERSRFAANLHRIVGGTGRVFLAETNFQGNGLHYVQHLGATARHIPAPLRRAIAELPMPGHFGSTERAAAFPAAQWQLLSDGPAFIEAVPMTGSTTEQIPGYYAVLAGRTA